MTTDHPGEEQRTSADATPPAPVMYEVILHFADIDEIIQLPTGGIPRKGDEVSWKGSMEFSDDYVVTSVHWNLDPETGPTNVVHLTLDPKD